MTSKRNKQRTYARNRIFSRTGREKLYESDGVYFHEACSGCGARDFVAEVSISYIFGRIALFWDPDRMFGLVIVNRFEKYQFNRKIWYAILILVTIVSFFLPAGMLI